MMEYMVITKINAHTRLGRQVEITVKDRDGKVVTKWRECAPGQVAQATHSLLSDMFKEFLLEE